MAQNQTVLNRFGFKIAQAEQLIDPFGASQ
jgi:hypothetical protein